jgi:hypothetical protein
MVGMAMGKRKRERQPAMWVTTMELPMAASHPFYRRLNELLRGHGFDDFAEAQCATFYADTMGRPGLRRVSALSGFTASHLAMFIAPTTSPSTHTPCPFEGRRSELCFDYAHMPPLPTLRFRPDDDLDVLTECRQETHETSARKVCQTAIEQCRDLWLIDAHQLRGGNLCQPPAPDDLLNAARELDAGELLLRLVKS